MNKPKGIDKVWQVMPPFAQPFWRSSIYVPDGQGWYSGRHKTQAAATRAMKAAADKLGIEVKG